MLSFLTTRSTTSFTDLHVIRLELHHNPRFWIKQNTLAMLDPIVSYNRIARDSTKQRSKRSNNFTNTSSDKQAQTFTIASTPTRHWTDSPEATSPPQSGFPRSDATGDSETGPSSLLSFVSPIPTWSQAPIPVHFLAILLVCPQQQLHINRRLAVSQQIQSRQIRLAGRETPNEVQLKRNVTLEERQIERLGVLTRHGVSRGRCNVEQEEIEGRGEDVDGIQVSKHVRFEETPVPVLLVLYSPICTTDSPEYAASMYCFNSPNTEFSERSSSVNNGGDMGIESVSNRLNTN